MVAFFIILAAGLLAVDFNKSYVIYGQPKFEIFKIEDLNNDIYRVWLMDSDFNLNLKYLKRDIKKLENYFK